MKTTNEALVSELVNDVKQHREQAINLRSMAEKDLRHKPSENAWNALECIEHLNRYGRFYLPEIRRRLMENRKGSPQSPFRSTWLGNYFAESLKPKEKLNRMKTFTNMDPAGSSTSPTAIDEFIAQQDELLLLLKQCLTTDLVKTRTSISISRLIRLRLGDTLRVVIYHNDRHMAQAFRALG